jgi:hypothetical protein
VLNIESDAPSKDQVLDAIVDMCRNRILSRIGSQTFAAAYSRTGKAFFGSPIQQVIDAVYAHPWGEKRRREVEDFAQGARKLMMRLDELEACQSDEIVCKIKSVVRAAHRLNETIDYDNIFVGLTERELNPTTRSGFGWRLAKLARYQECSLQLWRTATELRLFKDAEITIVSLDEQLFARSLTLPTEGCLAGCLSRCQNGALAAFREEKVASKLHTSDQEFRSSVRKYLKESRVHAEVQLLSYYELNPVAQKPRIICSSKDACYLCNLLIQLHGTFHIPRTHNYLYPGWRLLPLPDLDQVLTGLNQSLEVKIRELLLGLATGANTRYKLTQNVNESTVFPFSTSLPTLDGSSVMLAETSGSRAAEVHGTSDAQQDRQKAEAAPTAEQLDTPPPTPGAGTPDPRCPESKALAGSSHGTQPVTPELPSLEPPRGSQTHAALPNAGEESTREVNSPLLGESLETTQMPEQYLDGTRDQYKPGPGREPNRTPKRLPPQTLSRGQTLTLHPAPADRIPPVTAGAITLHPDFIHALIAPASAPPPPPSPAPVPTPTPPPTPTPTTTPTSQPPTVSPPVQVQVETHIHIQYLRRRRAAALYAARPRGFIDLALCQKGVEFDGGSAECVYVAYGGQVVMVDVVRPGGG